MKYIINLGACICVLLICSCAKNNEQDLTNACVTTDMSFSTDIAPLLNQSCAFTGCHSTGTQAAGIILDTHAGTLVHANSGKLVKSIKHESGVSPMPKNQSKLSDCTIDKITAWVDQGALDN